MTGYTHCLLAITTCNRFTSFIEGSQSNRLQLHLVLPKKQRNWSSRCSATLRKKTQQNQKPKNLCRLLTESRDKNIRFDPLFPFLKVQLQSLLRKEEGMFTFLTNLGFLQILVLVRKVSFLNPYIMDN